MKRLLLITALLPFAALAQPQPLNTMNNPNQPGYVIPSQQRMQTEMMNQQQQHLQTQMNTNTQRIQQGQMREQPLPNANGGMLNSTPRPSSGTLLGGDSGGGAPQQQHMLPQRQNGELLSPPLN